MNVLKNELLFAYYKERRSIGNGNCAIQLEKIVRRILLALMFLLFTSSALAENEKRFSFNLNYTELCRSVSATIFTHSRHAKGNRNGLLNEENYGYAGMCYHNVGRNLYTLVGGLENSQRGGTFLVGPGIRFRTPQVLRLSFEAGVELPFVYYGIPKHRAYVYGFLPVRYSGISFEPPMMYGTRLGTFEIGERRFGTRKEQVRLGSVTWTRAF